MPNLVRKFCRHWNGSCAQHMRYSSHLRSLHYQGRKKKKEHVEVCCTNFVAVYDIHVHYMISGCRILLPWSGPSEAVWHGGGRHTKNLQGERERERERKERKERKREERRRTRERGEKKKRKGRKRGEKEEKGRGEQEGKICCGCKTPPLNC